MIGKCFDCKITYVWWPGEPDEVFGELLPAPRIHSRAYCPACGRNLAQSTFRFKGNPIHHRNPIQGPPLDVALDRYHVKNDGLRIPVKIRNRR